MTIGTPTLGTVDRQTSASNSSTPGYPSTSAGDLLLLLGATGSGSSNIVSTDPSGWTRDQQHASTGDTVAPTIYAAHRLATGSESGSLSVAHGSTVSSFGIVRMTGVSSTSPVQSTTLLDQSTGSNTWVIPSVSVANAGSTLLYVASGNNTTSTFTPPSGWTEIEDGVSNLAASRCWSIGYKQGLSTGATGTANLGVSNSIRGLVVLYVINPSGTIATNAAASLSLAASLTANGATTGAPTSAVNYWTGSGYAAAVNRKFWTGSAWS